MTPEQLATILYTREVEYTGIKATPWDGLHESHRRKWYVLAEAAITALRGPRTGVALFCALNPLAVIDDYLGLPESVRSRYDHVAATFAAPKPPEGWPEGYSLAETDGHCSGYRARVADPYAAAYGAVAVVYGDTIPKAEHRARLIAHTLANQRPVWPAQVAEHWEARCLRAEAESARRQIQIEKLTEDFDQSEAIVLRQAKGIGGGQQEIERLRAEVDSYRARAESCHDNLIATQKERDDTRTAEALAQQRRQRVKAIALDLAGELADVRLAELKNRIEGADE